MKVGGSTLESRWILSGSSAEEASGIPGVAVECADIRRNTDGEGSSLGTVLTLRRESVGSEQD